MDNQIKIPTTNYNVHDLITKRWSARSFRKQAIEREVMNELFEAASWAASSMNEQPWKYVYAHAGSPAFDRMIDCLMPGNSPWAKDGAVMLLTLANRKFDRNGKPNRHHMHDVGAANTTLLLQAAQRDIYGHMMGGFHYDRTLEAFEIDGDEWEIACFIVLGYLDEPEALDEPYRSRELAERSRKSIPDFTQHLEQ